MSMDARTGEEHNGLIFSHEGNARAAASVILIGVIVALIGSVFMAIGPKVKQAPRPTSDASVGAAPTPVRIVGQTSARRCAVRPAGLAEYRSALSCPHGTRARSRQYIGTCAHQHTLAAACTNDNNATAVTGRG